MWHKDTDRLLMEISKKVGCAYLSDLHFKPYSSKALEEVQKDIYTDEDRRILEQYIAAHASDV